MKNEDSHKIMDLLKDYANENGLPEEAVIRLVGFRRSRLTNPESLQ